MRHLVTFLLLISHTKRFNLAKQSDYNFCSFLSQKSKSIHFIFFFLPLLKRYSAPKKLKKKKLISVNEIEIKIII